MDNKNSNQKPNQNPNQDGNKNRQSILVFLIFVLVSLVCMGLFTDLFNEPTSKEISYDKFISMVENDEVKKVEVEGDVIYITPKSDESELFEVTYYTNMLEDSTALAARLEDTDIEFARVPEDPTAEIIGAILSFLVPFILLIVIFNIFMRQMNKNGGGIMGVGKSKAKAYVQQETGVTFKDVAGQDEAKESLQEVVDFLHNPGKYTSIGAKLP